MEKYDLTNKIELKNVIKSILESSTTTNPIIFFGKKILDKVFSTETLRQQKATAEKLIMQGKEQGVDEMEITIKNSRGLKLNVPVEGVTIDTMIGADENMHIKVKYKQNE